MFFVNRLYVNLCHFYVAIAFFLDVDDDDSPTASVLYQQHIILANTAKGKSIALMQCVPQAA